MEQIFNKSRNSQLDAGRLVNKADYWLLGGAVLWSRNTRPPTISPEEEPGEGMTVNSGAFFLSIDVFYYPKLM